jgi:hypothetical protein
MALIKAAGFVAAMLDASRPHEDAFQEMRRAERLAMKLRELGIDPDAI